MYRWLICCFLAGIMGGLCAMNTPTIQEGYLAVPGGKVWYRIAGAEKTGVPLLIVHGGPGVPHDYLDNAIQLADERPVIWYDQLGCGRSPAPNDTTLWTLPRFVQELATVRQQLNLKKVHLLGQSWGAMLVVAYLQTHPQGIISCTLSAPCLDVPQWIKDQRVYLQAMSPEDQRIVARCEREGTYNDPGYQAVMMRYYQAHICRLTPWPEEMNRTFAGMGNDVYSYMWGASEFTCTGTLAQVNCVPYLGELNLPVLYTCGEFDEAAPATVREYHRATPGSDYLMIKGTSHMHHLERPDIYYSAVRSFLHQAETAAASK